MLRLAFVPLLKQQRPEFLIDAPARTDIDDINGGFVVIGTENHAIRSDPKRPIAGKLVMEGIAQKRVVEERTDAFSDFFLDQRVELANPLGRLRRVAGTPGLRASARPKTRSCVTHRPSSACLMERLRERMAF